MKTSCIYLYLLTCIIFSTVSCRKEYSLEGNQFSAGSLKNPLSGDCFPGKVLGNYKAGKSLDDSNYIEVEVNVTQAGYYSIVTNSVNGYYFRGSGIFSTTGSNIVALAAAGKPVAPGNNTFTITYDTSVCNITVNVQPAIIISPAVFTLRGSPNTCMIDTVFGNYLKGISLTTANYVKIGVDVSTIGSYTISTNAANGYNFSGSGLFTVAGVQTIILAASGTPLEKEVDQFTVTATTSSCTFTDTVLNAVGVINNDHFPLTANSYWNYDNLLSPGDTLKRNIIDSLLISGNFYKILEEKPMIAAPTQYFFRKAGDNYYEYGPVDKYTTSLQFSPQLKGDIFFLKENLTTGSTWTSDEFIGTLSSGQPIYLQYDFLCVDANAVVTINGNTFINVYKIDMMPMIRSAITYPYAGTFEKRHLYYAKGVGLIYENSISTGFSLQEFQVRNWHVY